LLNYQDQTVDEAELKICRHAYAVQMLAKAGVEQDEALLSAFSTVPREDFLGPPPWKMRDWKRYVEVPSSDPVVLYQDLLFALQADRQVNNGSPSLHAGALHRLALRKGETVCHIGAGSGYYTAIIAEIVGETGRVMAVEFDAELARQARRNLERYANVEVVHGDGLEWPREPADAIYVNFALHHPAEPWIDKLATGGRLLFPLGTPAMGAEGRLLGVTAQAAFFLISRERDELSARFLQPVNFVWGEGISGDLSTYAALDRAFHAGGLNRIHALRWSAVKTEQEWYSQERWGLVMAALH
jgi:protein-L-isoaspartate(D-aspartate) O-methyltransferase